MKLRVFLFLTMFFSATANAAKEVTIPLLSISGVHWSRAESDYIVALNRKGSLTIATKISSAVYMPLEDGSVAGFHYNVLNEFAELVGIKIDINLVNWDDYFYKDGGDLERVKSDPNYSYVPTLIERVDLYIDGITSLAWREKMFDIIKFVPSRQMVVARKGEEPKLFSDLNEKLCAMVRNTSMEQNLEKLRREQQLSFRYVDARNFDDMDKLVSEGKADFTVYDSDRAFAAIANFQNLTIAMPVSKPEIMGWAVNKNNKMLKRVLVKYFKYAQEARILDKYWKKSYGVTFVQYLRILKLGGHKH